jgi:bla regulator protein BlaR1
MLLREFLVWLFDASIAGGAIALAILLARHTLRHRLDGNIYYCLWVLFALRLILPPILPSPIDCIGGIVSSMQRILGSAGRGDGPSAVSRASDYSTLRLGDPGDYALTVIRSNRQALVFGVWLAGTILMLFLIASSSLRSSRELRVKRPIRDEEVLRIYAECRARVGIRREVRLMQSGAVSSPTLFGIVSPSIILPEGSAERLDERQLRYVILHELIHLRRKDELINVASCVIQAMHWFNPLVLYAFHCMRQDREAACDSSAVSRLAADERKEYGLTLLHFAQEGEGARVGLAMAPSRMAAGLKRRLVYLSIPRERTRRLRIVAGALLFATGCLVWASSWIFAGEDRYGESLKGSVRPMDLADCFEGEAGCFVVFDRTSEEYSIFNEADCRRRVPPDSTFKLLSALAGLDCGCLRDSRTILPWDGTIYPFPAWNEGQTLDTAMARSVNWFFARIDRELGPGKLRAALMTSRYGNQDMSGGLDDFWNESSLRISPLEQVEFLRNLNENRLPFSGGSVESVKRAIELGRNENSILSGKTGSGIVDDHYIRGWFVGYIASPSDTRYFATCIRGEDDASGEKAKRITLRILEGMKLWNGRAAPARPR